MAFVNPITKIIDTLAGIRNNTVGGVAAGALAVKELDTRTNYLDFGDNEDLQHFCNEVMRYSVEWSRRVIFAQAGIKTGVPEDSILTNFGTYQCECFNWDGKNLISAIYNPLFKLENIYKVVFHKDIDTGVWSLEHQEMFYSSNNALRTLGEFAYGNPTALQNTIPTGGVIQEIANRILPQRSMWMGEFSHDVYDTPLKLATALFDYMSSEEQIGYYNGGTLVSGFFYWAGWSHCKVDLYAMRLESPSDTWIMGDLHVFDGSYRIQRAWGNDSISPFVTKDGYNKVYWSTVETMQLPAETWIRSVNSVTIAPGTYIVHLQTIATEQTTAQVEMKVDTAEEDFAYFEKYYTLHGNADDNAGWSQIGSHTFMFHTDESRTLYMYAASRTAKQLNCELSLVKVN